MHENRDWQTLEAREYRLAAEIDRDFLVSHKAGNCKE